MCSITDRLKQRKEIQEEQEQEQQNDSYQNETKQIHQELHTTEYPALHCSKQHAAAAVAEALGLLMGFGDDADAYWQSVVLPQLVQVGSTSVSFTSFFELPIKLL